MTNDRRHLLRVQIPRERTACDAAFRDGTILGVIFGGLLGMAIGMGLIARVLDNRQLQCALQRVLAAYDQWNHDGQFDDCVSVVIKHEALIAR